MQDFHVIEKDHIVPEYHSEPEKETVSEESESESDAVESIRLLFKLPIVRNEASASESSQRAAKILLTLVASMVASQLLILGIALLVPRTRMIRVNSLVVSEPGTLVLKQESAAGVDYLFIFFHPIPALLEATNQKSFGPFSWINTGIDKAFQLRDSVGRSLFEWAAQLVASRPYQQVHKLISAALERLGLPA